MYEESRRLMGGHNATYYKNYKKGWKNSRF